MRKLTTKEAIDNLIRVLLVSGKKTNSLKWQGVPNPEVSKLETNSMVEVCGLFLKMKMLGPSDLAFGTGADLPWVENHFKERLSGASNPGKEYLNWPHCNSYTEYLDDKGKFSHTYQERFWPDRSSGFRYSRGNLADIMIRLSDDTTTRQAFLAVWHPEDQSNNGVRVPCTIGYWFKVTDGVLDITYLIRSCDARRHLRNDIYMTQRLAHIMLDHLNAEDKSISLGDMSMWIGSLHCFESDIYSLKKQMK